MQVSIETLSPLERRMTIEVPAEKVEDKVQSRLQEAAKNFHMKGFRKGKVPLKVIKKRFGKGVRQEVLGELMSQSYYEAVIQEKVKPAGQPRIEPKSLEEGKNLEFVATFEVYPEVQLQDFSGIEVEKKTAEITDDDIDKMIETLRQQRMHFEPVEREAALKDRLNIDFEGSIDGEPFAGGSAEGAKLILGSNQMIPGFEEQLVGVKPGEEKTLEVTFPEEYKNKELAGENAEFKVKVNSVEEPALPELDETFFASFDIHEGGLEAFRNEVRENMARELKNASRNNVKTQVINALLRQHPVDMPQSLLDQEIEQLRQQTVRQYGGGQKMDPSSLPAELFQEQAQRRVALGLIMGEIIKQNNLEVDPKKVRALVEEAAETYEEPEAVVKWYYSNKENLASVETMALEESVIDLVLESAKVNEVSTDYEEALKPTAPPKEEEAPAVADAERETPAYDVGADAPEPIKAISAAEEPAETAGDIDEPDSAGEDPSSDVSGEAEKPETKSD